MNETKSAKNLRELFTELVQAFTTHHDELDIEINQSANFISIGTTAHAEDSAKIIGRGAQNFNALRNLLNFAANKMNVRFNLNRIKDQPGTCVPDFQSSFVPLANWPEQEIRLLACDACVRMFKGIVVTRFEHQKDKSILVIEVASDEPFIIPEPTLQESLDIIFAAIGRNKGRKIGVRLARGDWNLDTVSNLSNDRKSNDSVNSKSAACRR